MNIIGVRRVPSMRAGYCYGSKILYVDAWFNQQLWVELDDTNLKLWKIFCLGRSPALLGPRAKVQTTLVVG
jgi:urease accessory protein UreH